MTRYRVEPTGRGFWPYCVMAGDGTRELFVGHKKSCERVAAELETAYRDGEFVGGQLRAELEHREILLEETRLAWDMALKASEHFRAELEAIRGKGVLYVSAESLADDGVVGMHATRKPNAVQNVALYALPPQQHDAVSVPRELLERISLSRPFEQARYQAVDELRALLSTKNAEEGE
ncbi:hypothetical protein N5C55_02710 [Pseudomonas otitidis]|uniref:hypothetical protein n=1 Tax=Metapseudomonas otitidis TaxID=319939 RepID=UPI002447804E|nr:hypothetical protein [Pseudomonas otitidis]MDH1104788.1 hypothetical protein [Pseudomonas otitidis]MDH1157075.1 hypothetical protein [Pseudomonas otitidis]MDH1164699.1 hypothetical protein [Pseudomonas otitidis]